MDYALEGLGDMAHLGVVFRGAGDQGHRIAEAEPQNASHHLE